MRERKAKLMEFIYEQALREYMQKQGKKVMVVEVVTSDYSDFEISELHVHLVDDKRASYFKIKKNYRSKKTDEGEVLLPPFRLTYDEKIIFGLKSFWFLKYVTYQGIRI